MHVRVRFFAIHRERLGTDQLDVELTADSTLADLVQSVATRFPDLSAVLQSARFAVNREYVPTTATLHDGDEVAFIPPVAGGEITNDN